MATATDVDGDDLTYSFGTDINGDPITTLDTAHGTVIIDPVTGQYSFTPDGNYNGADTFQVIVTDGQGGTATATVDVTVDPVNDDPVIGATPVETDEDITVSGSIVATDAENNGLTYSLADHGGTSHGQLTLNSDGRFSYTPDTNYSGADSFIVRVDDGHGGVTEKTIQITVDPVADGVVITAGDASIILDPGSNDSIVGTYGADTLVGGAGNDTLWGNSGADVIYGDGGTATSHSVALTIDIAKLDDSETVSSVTLTGLPAGSSLSAGSHNPDGSWTVPVEAIAGLTLTVNGTVTDDFTIGIAVTTTDGDDSIQNSGSLTVSFSGAADGNDTIYGGTGEDTIYGGGGNDTIDGGQGTDIIHAGSGDDLVKLGNMVDGTWGATWGAKDVGGTQTEGTQDFHSVSGYSRTNDTIDGGDGHDTLQGSSGNDAIFLDTVNSNPTSGAMLSSIEVINAGDGNDVVDLTSDRFDYGSVTVDGGSGNDLLWTADGDDTIYGGSGNDTINAGAGDDLVDAGSGDDLVTAVKGEVGHDVYHGGDGTDTLRVMLKTADYTDDVREELQEFKAFIENPANAGVSFTFVTLGGLTVDSFEALKLVVDGVEINLNSPPSVTAITGGTGVESINDATPTVVTGSITASDSDGDSLTYSVTDAAAAGHHGTLAIDQNGNYTFTAADPDWDGTDTFTVQISDGHGGVTTQSVTITVTPQADAPSVTASAVFETVGGSGAGTGSSGGAAFDNADRADTANATAPAGTATMPGGANWNQTYYGNGDDVVATTTSASGVYTNGGNDTVYGANTYQQIYTGSGDDTIIAGNNGGQFSTGNGNDTVLGGAGSESIWTDQDNGNSGTTYAGNDTVFANAGNDAVWAGGGNDTVSGGSGNDSLWGGSGNDLLRGDAGNDDLYGEDGVDTLYGGSGNDRLFLGTNPGGQETAIGGAGHDYIQGSDGSDLIYGGDADGTSGAGTPATTLYADITITGAVGDTSESLAYIISGLPAGVSLVDADGHAVGTNLGGNSFSLTATEIGGLRLAMASGTADFDLSVSAVATEWDGNSTNTTTTVLHVDVPAVSAATDYGSSGSTAASDSDSIDAGAGNDTIFTGSGNDVINTGTGDDVVYAGDGNNIINNQGGSDTIHTGSGNDTIETSDDSTGNDVVYAGDGNNKVDLGNGDNTIISGSGADSLTAGSGDDVIEAGDGQNTIHAGGGNNTITAGSGDDIITSNSGNDIIHAGDGNNTIHAGDGDNTIVTGSGADSVTTGSGADVIDLGGGNDTLYSGAGNDIITGGAGNDFIHGDDGNDTFLFDFGAGHDTIDGGSGWDKIDLTGMDGGSFSITLDYSGWTTSVDTAAQNTGDISLSDHGSTSGTLTLNDGSEIHFQNLEEIKW